MARMLPREAENGVGMNRCLPWEESVKRFERSNGLDTALYKTIPLPFFFTSHQILYSDWITCTDVLSTVQFRQVCYTTSVMAFLVSGLSLVEASTNFASLATGIPSGDR